MSFLPIAYDISGGYVLMLGNNKDVLNKIRRLSPYTNKFLVVHPEISQEVRDTGVDFREEKFNESHLDGAVLLYDYTEEDNRQIWQLARDRGIPVNVHDDAANCDFVSPAIYHHGGMSVAVSSNARDVRRSIKWRNKIRDYFDSIFTVGDDI